MQTDILMPYMEIVVVFSEKYRKHVNGFCGQNVDCFKAKPSGAQSNNHPSPTPKMLSLVFETH
jgi:hypothetical protein